jgi:hypothetical protein
MLNVAQAHTGGCKKRENFDPTRGRISVRLYSHQYQKPTKERNRTPKMIDIFVPTLVVNQRQSFEVY